MTGQMMQPADDGRRSPFAAASGIRSPVGKLILAGGLAAAVFGAWWFTRAAPSAQPEGGARTVADTTAKPVMLTAEDERRIGVTYAVVARAPLAGDVRAAAVLAYDETRVKTIAPKVDGYVEELFVAFTGQAVDLQEPLLRIYSPMLVTAQEELLLALKLDADVGTGNPDAARQAADLVNSARRRLKYWDVSDEDVAQVERTGQAQRSLTLRSPLGGVVVQKTVQAGQRVMAGDPLYQVADLHEVWLEGEIFEADLPVVRIGQTVSAEFTAMGGGLRTGRVVFISPSVSSETRTTKIRIALSNHDGALKPGMFATIHLRGDAGASTLSVPRAAVLVTGARTLVFVKGADGMLTPRDVILGMHTDDRIEIVRGVREGETVVASATFLVDAESNLGSALGAMAGMPGMDHGPPVAPPAKALPPNPDPMAGMNHGPTKKP